MVPAGTLLAQTPAAGTSKPRFVGVFYPHGMAPGYWEPEKEGALPENLPYIPEVLKNVKDQSVVISGLWSKSAEPPEGTTGSDHWVAAAFLTAIKPKDCGFRCQRRQQHHRSAHCGSNRSGKPAAVTAARRRGSEFQLQQLR